MNNEKIESAIEAFHENQSKETFTGIMLAIHKSIKEEGQLIIPVETPMSLVELIDLDTVKPGDIITTPTEVRMKLQRIKVDNDIWLAAFTNEEEVKNGAETSTITQSTEMFLRSILKMDDVEGVIINPWGIPFYMDKRMVYILFETIQSLQ